MAGKTYIGGTAYDIKKGKTMIGGTAYDIKKGKTYIGATAYDIKFGPSITIEDLMSDMNHLQSFGRDRSTNGTVSMETYYLPSTLQYMIGISYGDITIYKTAGSSSITHLKTSGGTSIDVSGSPLTLKATYNGTVTSSLKGGCLFFVDFPTYASIIEEVDLVLSQTTYTKVAGRNSSTSATLQTNDKTYPYYITCKYGPNGTTNTDGMGNGGMTFWSCDGTSYTKIKQVGAAAGAISGSYLTLGSCYGGSIIGISV